MPVTNAGSSLRAQGTPVTASALKFNTRFIAGADHQQYLVGPPVHPCGRREHCTNNKKTAYGRAQHRSINSNRRFIPAGAGNTRFCRGGKNLERLHCGRREHWVFVVAVHPCGRREHILPEYSHLLESLGRFIPAGAGNTSVLVIPCTLQRNSVHPCGRREHADFMRVDKSGVTSGSSLRAQGTRSEAKWLDLYNKFGSSLRAQGTRVLIATSAGPSTWRFIPAGAGNTYFVMTRINISQRFIPAGAGNTTTGH